MKETTILGIDPGTGRVGWAILKLAGNKEELIECGCFETEVNSPLPQRLEKIYSFIQELIDKFKPDEAALEELFFATNAKTVMAVGMSRGVITLAITQKKIPLTDYPPLKVKMAITGFGKADKKQIQFMVTQILKLPSTPKPDDAADAVAVALTHAANRKLKTLSDRMRP